MDRLILWDFDGTLAFRPGMWRGCLIETLDAYEPGHSVCADDLIPWLRDGFPWHAAETPHPQLGTAEAWWAHVGAVLRRAYERVGLAPERAAELAVLARQRYVDCSVGWHLFDDTVPALEQLAGEGWRHAILSNHVPELPALVEGLGLSSFVERTINSATTGYEKPHPEAFAVALRECGHPGEVWMVGDNPVADVAGAEAAGIPAILVRADDGDSRRRAATLLDVAAHVS